jgi:ATP-dependent DNA helicase 2 subunit 1
MPLHFPAKTTAAGDGISLLEALLTTINVRAVGQRALFTLPLEIGAGLTIGVKGFPMIKRQEVLKTCWIWVGGDQLQVAVGTTTNIAEDTARTVTNDEIRKAYMFGGEQLFFDDDDMKWLRYFGEPAINILGFKPLSMLPPWANTRTPTFLRAEETNFVGSSRVFSALYQKLFADQKFALAWTITRRNVMPILAALVPGSEKLHDSGEQYVPEGLWLVPLPYRDDIRQNPETPLVQAPARLVDRMKLVLNQMRLPGEVYDPRKYPNPGNSVVFTLSCSPQPALQWFYKVVQALALDEDIPPFKDSDDKTKPRYRQIQKVGCTYVEGMANNPSALET